MQCLLSELKRLLTNKLTLSSISISAKHFTHVAVKEGVAAVRDGAIAGRYCAREIRNI